MTLWAVSRHEEERERFQDIREGLDKPGKCKIEVHANVDDELLHAIEDDDVIVGKLPMGIIFNIKKDVFLFTPYYSFKNGERTKLFFNKYIICSVEVVGEPDEKTALIFIKKATINELKEVLSNGDSK